MNAPLHECPTCFRSLDEATRHRMGLRNGEVLASLCPDRIGPSDIDHIVHNGRANPERFLIFEYKRGSLDLGLGQKYLLDSLKGNWVDEATGRRIMIGYAVLPLNPELPREMLAPYVSRLFAGTHSLLAA